MKDMSVGRLLFQYKNLIITSTMKLPDVIFNEPYGKFDVLGAPILYMRITGISNDLSPYITITVDTIYNFVHWLNNILAWYYDTRYEKLYYRNDVGQWSFNMDYNELHEDMPQPEFSNTMLRAYPNIVKLRTFDPPEKGAILVINRQENAVEIRKTDIQRMLSIFYNFSFQNESVLLLQSLMYAQMTNSVRKKEANIKGMNATADKKPVV